MIRVRVDDFPNTKGEPQHTLAAYREFDRCLRELIGNKRYLLGVIPNRCDVDDILFLRNETDCVIGMHGITHDEKQLDLYQNEFPPFLTQKDVATHLISTVGALDEAIGRDARIYMPPRNRIDKRTVDVLHDIGFFGYTTGSETPENLRLHELLSVYHSEPPHEYGRTDEMLKRNSQVHLRAAGEAVLTLHWTWETNIGLQHMRNFLGQIPKDLFVDFDG